MKKGLVSIILPTYNRKDSIKDAIDSCLTQTYQKIEIIICDDHSTDHTKEYIKERMKEDPRIRYCVTPEGKKGANAARNTAIKIAQGEYITFLDSDDYLTKDSISNRVEVIEKNDVGMVYGNVICESAGRRIKWIYTDLKKEHLSQKKYLMQELSLCQQNTIMVKAVVFDKIGLLDENQKGWTDDGLVVAVGMKYQIMHSGTFVAVVRKSDECMTKNKWNMYYGCKCLVQRYAGEIIRYASFERYLLWKLRLFSLYCLAKKCDSKTDHKKKEIWDILHRLTRKVIWRHFRNHFE